MADDTAKTQSEEKEKRLTVPETPEKEQKEELTEAGEQKAGKREEVKEESVKGRTETKLEQFEHGEVFSPDTETPQKIESIRTEKLETPEEESNFTLMGTVAVTIMTKLLNGGIKLEEISSLDGLKKVMAKVETDPKYKNLRQKLSNFSEKATWGKLKEILDDPKSAVYKKLEGTWDGYVEKAGSLYEEAADAIKGKATESVEWIKKNPGKAALLAVGAFALYYILKPESKNDKKTFALGVATIGAILGGGKLIDWISENLTDEPLEIAKRSVEKANDAAANWLNNHIKFDETKNRLLKQLPAAPDWLTKGKFKEILVDMGINPEESETWKQYEKPGGAALLLYHWITKKHQLDKKITGYLKKFVDKEQKRPTAPETPSQEEIETVEKKSFEEGEKHPEYGEMEPLNKSWGNYTKALDKELLPLKEFALSNKAELAVLGLFLTRFETFRSIALSGVKGSYEAFSALASVPFKAVKGFPLSSLFLVSAALLAQDRYQILNNAGEIMVPKDPENLKKYLRKKLEEADEYIDTIRPFHNKHIDTAVHIIQEPSLLKDYIGDPEEMLEDIVVESAKLATLEDIEIIRGTNSSGLSIFRAYLEDKFRLDYDEESDEYEQYDKLINEVKSLTKKVKAGGAVDNSEILATLSPLAEPLGFNFEVREGYLEWSKKDLKSEIPIVFGPKKLIVDSNLEKDEQLNYARRYVTNDNLGYATLRGFGYIVEELRMGAEEILFEDVEEDADFSQFLEKKLNTGWRVYGSNVLGAWIYKTVEGTVHRYYLGPFNTIKHALNGVSGDFSYTEAMVDYADGFLPILILGATKHLAKAESPFGKKLLLKSAAYPVRIIGDAASIGWHVLRNVRKKEALRAMFIDPQLAVKAEFFEAIARWHNFKAFFKRGDIAEIIRAEAQALAQLRVAQRSLYQANYHGLFKESVYFKQAESALGRVEGMESKVPDPDSVEHILHDIEVKIDKRERYLASLDELQQLAKASNKVKKGKVAKAEKILSDLGLKGPATTENIEKHILNSKKRLHQIDLEINPKRAEYRLEKFGDAEKVAAEHEAASKAVEKMSLEDQKAHIDETKDIEKEINDLAKERQNKLKEAKNTATEQGKTVAEITDDLEKIKTEYDGKIEPLFEKWRGNFDLLDKFNPKVLKKEGIDLEEIKKARTEFEAKLRGQTTGKKLLRSGKRIAGLAILLLSAYGIHKGIEWLHTDEKLDLDKDLEKLTPGKKESNEDKKKIMEDDPKFTIEVIKDIHEHFKGLEADYIEFNALLGNPEKVKTTSEEEAEKIFDKAAKQHLENIEKIKKFLAVNRDAFLAYYKHLPEHREKDISFGQFFSIGFDEDEERPYLKYVDEGTFLSKAWEHFDTTKSYADEIIAGKDIPITWQVADAGSYAIPLVGTGRDIYDTYEAITRGDASKAWESGGWALVGVVSDGLIALSPFTAAISGAAGAGLRAVRVAGAGTKATLRTRAALKILNKYSKFRKGVESVSKSRTYQKVAKHEGKIIWSALGADIGRQIFTPDKSEKYVF